ITSDKACNWSMAFLSVIGEGRVLFIDNESEKIKALNIIMSHYSDKDNWDFNKKMMGKTLVFKVEIENISFKKSGIVG
ncbi:MAG: hypothetical protein J7L71_01140, partial [Spirochaetaceae bacterium]|nr:hypothetical protein [Spirochaetaceae bacterium]